MAMADDLTARVQTVRARLENLRPNILPNLRDKLQQGQGLAGGNLLGRAQAVLQQRPIIGQAMQGTLITGGKPNAASAALAINKSGFREVPGAKPGETTILAGGYRLAQ